jgi:transitional endoplasmic reticulum ATPase
MKDIPSFLRRQCKPARFTMDSSTEPYRPLLASWMIDLALCFGWHRKAHQHEMPKVLRDESFIALTGIALPTHLDEDGDLVVNRNVVCKMSEGKLVRLLEKRLEELRKSAPTVDLPLFRNIELLGNRLSLNDAEKAILAFAVALNAFAMFKEPLSNRADEVTNQQLISLIASISGQADADIRAALRDDAPLAATGIIRIDPNGTDIVGKIDLIDRLPNILLMPDADEATLLDRLLRRASPTTLDLKAFPHLARDVGVLLPYLKNAIGQHEAGANVLFYGPPGTGKTELVKAIAAELGLDLFEIAFSDSDGDPIKGEKRLRAYNLCQKIAANMPNALLMFDEIEDVFPSQGIFAFLFAGSNQEAATGGGKAWINRSLERNPAPAIWVTNDSSIDPAYLRRFDYSVNFPIPPQAVRMQIAQHHFGQFEPPTHWLARIAANDQASPAQLERAARVARIASDGDPRRALALVEQTLDRSGALLDQKRIPSRNVLRTCYDLCFINVDTDIPKVLAGLKRRPSGTFCFYGPAGTGKSELGRHLADEIGKPVLFRRASDILSMWVGEAEKNIARMFAEARQQDAVLILDEADSFLADRRDAQASWEVTQVNELLTQMEAFDGVFVCTTNLMQKLDQASLRRFAFKVKFDFLTPTQRWLMYRRELARLGGDLVTAPPLEDSVRRLDQLTPGDFAVAARQYELWGTSPTAEELYEQLRRECIGKGGPERSIGFIA